MGTMGSFFNGGSRNKPRYERLPLDTFFPSGSTITRTHDHHDDLDEDNLLFDLDNQASQNGRLLSAKNGYDSEEEIEFYKDTRRSRDRRNSPPSSCCCLVCLLVVLVVVALLFGALYLIRPRAQNTVGLGWTSSTYEYATETAMRLYDVNQDGIEDVILGAAVTSSLQDIENEIEFCRKHDMKYPCAGLIMALDGRNGTRLWTIYTKVEVFAIQCGKLDINQDGHMDCVAAGRMATLHGIDPIQGVILWSADPSVTNPHFNFYQGQVVPDLDQDGVQDFVVTHGGDTRFSEKELDRPAGRLLLLSGKTGRSLGRYLSLPDEHETYSAITLYTRHNGAVYLLFGSGGETIAGSLWTISLRDLYCYVMSITTCSADSLSHVAHLQNKGYEERWGTPIQTLSSGVKEIIRSDSSKGVTVPTELVDMNNDGVEDLVVFMYNSTITVLNGLNLEVIWSTGSRFVEFETYSNPAPGYFNDDDTVDLMVRLSKGTWPNFKSTYVYILDGRNGEILWYLKTPSIGPVMSSPLTLQSYGRKDAFIFWAQGLSGEIRGEGLEPPGHEMGPEMGPDMGPETGSDMGPEMGSEVGSEVGPEMGSEVGSEGVVDSSAPQGRPRRHGGMGPDQPCLLSMDVFRADLLLVDRDLALKPLRLASIEAYKYNYSLTEEDRLLLKEKLHDDQDLGAMETVPPDTHVTPPSKSAPPPTKAMVTEEDLARHDLHRHMTTSANAVTTPEDVYPEGPEGLEPTTIAASIPVEIGPSTVAGTLPEGLQSTIKALTSPEGQESRAAMSTSEIIEETTLRQETIQTSSVGEVVELSTPSTTSLVKDIETSSAQPTNEIFSTGSENSTPMSTNSESTNSETTTKTFETTVSGVSTTSETTGPPREEITTVSMPETTTPLDLATDLLEVTTEGSQTATETATSPDVNASASTLALETSSLEATATSELATQSTQLPATEFEDYPQRKTSESETGTLSLDDITPPMEINSGPQVVNSSSPQAVNSSSPQAVNSSSPQAVNSSSPQAVNSSSPQAVNASSPQAVNSNSPQAVNSNSPQAVNSSSPQAVNSSSPQAVNSSSPQAVNLTHTSSSNNKSDTDTNEPTLLPVSQGTNHSSEESHIETTDDDENTELSLNEEITNNNQSTTHLAELFTELGMVADQETSTPQKPETPSKPASGSEGGEEHRRRRETSGSDLCLVYQPSLFGTGIIGDLDNDGNLDYVYVETQMAQLTDEDSHYLTTKLRLRVHRLVLKSAITRRDWVRLEDDQVMLSEGVSREEVDVEELEEHFRFLPADKQSWTSYMGENGDEKFRKNNR